MSTKRPVPGVIPFLIGVVAIVGIGLLDSLTAREFSFSIFYLFPIVLGTWWGGRSVGYPLAFAGSVVWLSVDLGAADVGEFFFPLWNAGVRLVFFAISVFAVWAVGDRLREETESSNTDALTGAVNARGLYRRLEAELKRNRRTGRPLTVAFLDLDNMKQVNDELGHLIGDRVLQQVVQTLHSETRWLDTVARVGGDEFIVLLPETGADGAHTCLVKIQEAIKFSMGIQGWPVTASVGVSTFQTVPDMPPGDIIKMADELMYAAKRSGKNRFVHEVIENGRRVVLGSEKIEAA